MSRRPGKITYTKHAEERMKLRWISHAMIADTLAQPDRTQIEEDGDTEFIRTLEGRKIYVIAKHLANSDQWLIKSTWVRGEDDPQALWRRALSWLSRRVRPLFRSQPSKRRR